MADRHLEPDSPELRARWGSFAWSADNAAQAKIIVSRYPEGRQRSAVMPLLDLAQRQVGAETNTQGWLPLPVMEYIARDLGMPVIRVLEVATFYFMYNLVPVGRFHVQVCGTTPCMLRGSDDLFVACKARGMRKGHTTEDGLWTLTEVECMGNCASAPMVQINDDNFEDLTPESLNAVLDALAAGKTPKTGTQLKGRHTVEPLGGPTTLKQMVKANHDYRGEWK
jgi:NADH-quinone oxidoreductase subunit E